MSEQHWFFRKQGKKWVLLAIVLFINLLVIFNLIFVLDPMWGEINYFIGNFIGWYGNYVLILILIIAIPLTYSGIMVILNVRKLIKSDRVKFHLLHKTLSIFFLILFNMFIFVLMKVFGEEAIVVSSYLEDISIFLFLGIIIGLLFILDPIITYLRTSLKSSPRTKGLVVLVCMVVGYGVGFSLPFIFQPANVIYGDLPQKPFVIAHRGAAHLAPENTIIAGDLAANLSAYGWEIDIQISLDGIPFLMHDDTLQRTTNLSEQFPGREDEPASNFTIAELKQLDAGSWFVDKDPYLAIGKGLITHEEAERYRNIQIPTLEEVVNFTRDRGFVLDADFKGAPEGHPFHNDYFNICLNILKSGGFDEKIIIQTSNRRWLNITMVEAPNMITGLIMSTSNPLSTTEFKSTGYDIGVFHYSIGYNVIQAYASANIPLRLWTVDTVVRFSQLWCQNISYVLTNEPHKFIPLAQPSWYLHINVYVVFWLVIILLGVSYVLIIQFEKPKEN